MMNTGLADPERPRRGAGVLGRLALLLAALQFASVAAWADGIAGSWVTTEQTQIRLFSAVTGTGDLKSLPIGLEMRLKPGWKTYWRSPGDAGFPPEITFAGSQNLAKATMAYPAPHRFELFGLQTFGYGDQVVFPIDVLPTALGGALAIRAHLRYLVCEQVCIPYEADLALDLPQGPAKPSADAALFNEFGSMVPGDGRGVGLDIAAVKIVGDRLQVAATSAGGPFTAPDLLIEAPAGLGFGKPEVAFEEDRSRVRLTLPIFRDAGSPDPNASELTLTLLDGKRGMERRVTPGKFIALAASASSQPRPASHSLIAILGIALLGGLILNFMPCVLPVLVLKLTGVLEHGGSSQTAIRRSFVASAAGIVSAFLALAAVLVALKATGHSIGWGIQFQQPVFLGALAAICLVFAANLWGFFEVPLPALAGDLALAVDRTSVKHKRLGAFLTGVLATILATPCSAPLVGTAIGFALSRGAAEIFMIFAALGLGLAAPYLAIAVAPRLAAALPRPGRWMIGLKRVLGLSLAATALWLLWVMAGQTGLLARPMADAAGEDSGIAWRDFDEPGIPGLVASGKVVFVDVTADWCLTCQANKKLVLDRSPVRERLAAPNVVAERADWTQPSAVIVDYLGRHGRYGIPFNMVYGPGAPLGIPLPELLTDQSVLDALDAAGGTPGSGS